MGKTCAEATRWLQARPDNTQVRWCSIDLPADEPWARRFADIMVLGYCPEEPGTWAFTIESTRRSVSYQDYWYIRHDYDLDVHAVSHADVVAQPHFALAIAVPAGSALAAEQDAALAQALLAEPGRRRGVVDAWSPEQISRALNRWAAESAGRPDITFAWDDQADLRAVFPGLYCVLDQIDQARGDEGYEVTPGIKVGDEAMDNLLRIGPLKAAIITRLLPTMDKLARDYDPFAER